MKIALTILLLISLNIKVNGTPLEKHFSDYHLKKARLSLTQKNQILDSMLNSNDEFFNAFAKIEIASERIFTIDGKSKIDTIKQELSYLSNEEIIQEDFLLLGTCYYKLGLIELIKGNLSNSHYQLSLAQKQFKKLNNHDPISNYNQARVFATKGYILKQCNDLTSSNQELKKAISYFKKAGLSGSQMSSYNLLIEINIELEKIDLAEEYFKEMQSIFPYKELNKLNQIGYKLSEFKILDARNEHRSISDKYNQINHLMSNDIRTFNIQLIVAKSYLELNKKTEFFKILETLEHNIQKDYKHGLLSEYYVMLARFYQKQGLLNKSNHYREEYLKAFQKESSYRENQSSLIFREQIGLIDKIQTLNQKEIELEQIEKSKLKLNYTLIALTLILIIGFWYQKRLKVSNKSLSVKVKENKLLLKEIHHRVKNNLQLVSSILSLEELNTKNEEAINVLRTCKDRIISISIVHNKLYQDSSINEVNLSSYVKELCDNQISFNPDIVMNLDVEDLKLELDTLIPLGLIINELITNSLKHAFQKTEYPEINITIKQIDRILKFTYMDNGIFLVNKKDSKSLGVSLIEDLVYQLKAESTIDTSNGYIFSLNFHL